MSVFRGEYTTCDEKGAVKVQSSTARSTALDRFLWYVKHVKETAALQEISCEDAALYLDNQRVVFDSRGKRSVKTLNKYMEEFKLHARTT